MPSARLVSCSLLLMLVFQVQNELHAQGTRLLRQPTISETKIAFEYGADIWVVENKGGEAKRITSTPATKHLCLLSHTGSYPCKNEFMKRPGYLPG